MTKAQEKKVEFIKTEIEDMRQSLHRNGEIKKFEVIDESSYGYISVLAEIGGIDDDGTLAEIYARDRIHVFIGVKGGISYYDNKCKKHSLGRKSLLSVSLSQRNF